MIFPCPCFSLFPDAAGNVNWNNGCWNDWLATGTLIIALKKKRKHRGWLQRGIKVKHYCGILSLHGVHECEDEWAFNSMGIYLNKWKVNENCDGTSYSNRIVNSGKFLCDKLGIQFKVRLKLEKIPK